MKQGPFNLNLPQLLGTDLDPFRIKVAIQSALDLEAGFGGGGRDQIDDHLVADQRFPAPILADMRKQAMLDFIPFAGPGRKETL